MYPDWNLSWRGQDAIKDIIGQKNVDRSNKSILSILNFLHLVTALWLPKRKSLFLGNTHLSIHHRFLPQGHEPWASARTCHEQSPWPAAGTKAPHPAVTTCLAQSPQRCGEKRPEGRLNKASFAHCCGCSWSHTSTQHVQGPVWPALWMVSSWFTDHCVFHD